MGRSWLALIALAACGSSHSATGDGRAVDTAPGDGRSVDATPDAPGCMLGAFLDAPASSSCVAASWTTELASTDGKSFIEGTAAVDAAGGVHASTTTFNPNGLRYLYRAPGGGWTQEAAPFSGIPNLNSLTLALDGTVHLAYRDTSTVGLAIRYAWRDTTGTWAPGVIYPGGNPDYPSIQADTAGRLHCAFGGASNTQAGYAYRDPPGAWSTAELFDNNVNAYNTTLAVDSCGGVHVAYTDMGTNHARYAYRDPTTAAWTIETIATASSAFAFGERAIMVDGAGVVHVAFAGAGGLVYARRVGGAWTLETADATPNRGCETAIARDESGAIDIAYKHCSNPGAWFARRTPDGTWTVTSLDATAVYLGPAMLAVDSGYGVHALWKSSDGNITYGFARVCP